MSALRFTYLVLALIGAVVPMFFFVRWFNTNGFDLVAMAADWNATDAGRGLVWDLTIAAVALTVFIISETLVRRDYWILICIPATFCIGVSCGLPLYLFLRSRPSD